MFDVVGAALNDIQALAGNLTNPFGPAAAGEWNLKEASFINEETKTTTVFWIADKKDKPKSATAISQATDGGGRRLAVYEYPFRDGQTVEDLGRRGEKFSFEIKFFGADYQSKLNDFIKNVAGAKGKGKLSHPIRGLVPARFESWEFIHRYDEWNAVSIRASFIEDNQGAITDLKIEASLNMSLRNALQAITDAQAFISEGIFKVSALLLIPNAIRSSLIARLTSVAGQLTRLFAQLAATFAGDDRIRSLAAQATNDVNSFLDLYSAKINSVGRRSSISGTSGTTTIPPIYQVGYSAVDQAKIDEAMSQFITANTITPQQAVYSANEVRASISGAILQIRNTFGNDGYEIEMAYREMAIQIQEAVQSSISAANANVKLYIVPQPMSLRMAAFRNGLSKDRQNDIERMNPYLPSINWIPEGTQLVLPAS